MKIGNIHKGCFFRALPGLQAYDGLTIASWFINKEEASLAREFLVASKTRLHQAAASELMPKEIAEVILKEINNVFDALDNKNYKEAEESVAAASVMTITESM